MIVRFMAVLAFVAALVWLIRRFAPSVSGSSLLRRGYDFSILFHEGRKRSVDGVVPRSVYNAFEDVAALTGVSGRVSVTGDGSLDFSEDVPEGVRQQFQNAWWAGRGA